jgi:hypothetical protein
VLFLWLLVMQHSYLIQVMICYTNYKIAASYNVTVGCRGELLWTWYWTFRLHNRQEISVPAEWLSTSQGLCPHEVNYVVKQWLYKTDSHISSITKQRLSTHNISIINEKLLLGRHVSISLDHLQALQIHFLIWSRITYGLRLSESSYHRTE